LRDLQDPKGKASRWDGQQFSIPWDGIGSPIPSLQIPMEEGGGPASNSLDTTLNIIDKMIRGVSKKAKKSNHGITAGAYYWGPSVSWNAYLECWVMVMSKLIGPHFQGHQLYISFNPPKI